MKENHRKSFVTSLNEMTWNCGTMEVVRDTHIYQWTDQLSSDSLDVTFIMCVTFY